MIEAGILVVVVDCGTGSLERQLVNQDLNRIYKTGF